MGALVFRCRVVAFLIHLRVHYQVFILSGGFLLGGLYSRTLDLRTFLVQFFVVHILLNGGVTAYNSFWDDDDGPIGGVENPPKMAPWMHHAALVLQFVGLGFATLVGPIYVGLYVLTMVLSVAYSRRGPRFKGHPILSLVAVGVGTGTNTFLLGAIAAGRAVDPELVVAAVGTAALLLSLYPVSQVFQIDDDRRNGDVTFAVAYGLSGVRRFFVVMYPLGLVTVAVTLWRTHGLVGLVFGGVGAVGGLIDAYQLFSLRGEPSEYKVVMRLKYVASLSFVLFLCAALYWTHRPGS